MKPRPTRAFLVLFGNFAQCRWNYFQSASNVAGRVFSQTVCLLSFHSHVAED
ncbi:unnamed protein product, partial [Mycena citricolor]